MLVDYLRGVLVPLATAFDSRGEIDKAGMKKLTAFVAEKGIRGIIPAGSTGEFFALSAGEKAVLLETVLEEVNGKIAVFAGTGAVSTRETIELTRQAEHTGAQGALVITPYYISPSQEDIYEHYCRVAESTSLPIIIYSNPGRTGGIFPTPETIEKLAAVENIIGLKDSSGNMSLTAEYIRRTQDMPFSILMGQDKLFFAGMMHGCTGLVAATANVAPALIVNLYNACIKRDVDRALELQSKVTLIRNGFESLPFPVAAKAMMKLVGLDVGTPRAPLGLGRKVSLAEENFLRDILSRTDLSSF